MKYPLFTDCTGSKSTAIKKGVLSHTDGIAMQMVETTFNEKAPTAKAEFEPSIKRRLAVLKVVSNKRGYYITIQKGFYLDGGKWYMGGIVALSTPEGITVSEYLKGIAFPDEVQRYMDGDIKLRHTAMQRHYQRLNPETDSYYEFISGEPEIDWMERAVIMLITKVLPAPKKKKKKIPHV